MLSINVLAVHRADYRKCPRKDCNYIGTIDLKPCNDLLQCGKCRYQWPDPALYPFAKKACIKLQNFFSVESELFTNMQKVIKGEPCPNCGICIIKLDGCSHMVCGKCSHEFCWMCLGHFPSYVHAEETF
mmetsp:Transcript_26865/g.31018  ORF Transcript_26865/g.31018 Transcript_26865/m.31018 type:complete len:129 (+) Transcript_26865:323-709(+)